MLSHLLKTSMLLPGLTLTQQRKQTMGSYENILVYFVAYFVNFIYANWTYAIKWIFGVCFDLFKLQLIQTLKKSVFCWEKVGDYNCKNLQSP